MKFAHSILYIFYFIRTIFFCGLILDTIIIYIYIVLVFIRICYEYVYSCATHDLWNPPVWFQNIMSVVSLTALIGTPISYCAYAIIIIIKIQIQKKTHIVLNMLIGLELFLEHMNTK